MKSASRVGAVATLTVVSAPAAVVGVVFAALAMRAAGGERALEGGPWRELLLGVVPLGPALVLALGARSDRTRLGVVPLAALLAFGSALVTTCYFLTAAPIVGGDASLAVESRHVSWGPLALRLAVCLAPVLVGLGVLAQRRPSKPMPVMAGAALGAAMMALLLSAARVGSPPPSGYLGTLEPSVPIVANRSFRLGAIDFVIEPVESRPIHDPWAVEHRRPGGGCVLRGPGEPLPLGNLFEGESKCSLGWDSTASSRLQNITSAVYVDPRGDIAVLYQPVATGPYVRSAFAFPDPRSAPSLCDGCATYALALRTRDGARVTLDLELLGNRLSAPASMQVACVIGMVAALGLLGAAWKVRRAARNEVGRDAMHEGGGAVRLGDTVPLELAAFAIALVTAAPLIGAHVAGL